MITRYKLLPKFPEDLKDFIHSEYHRVIGDHNLEKFVNSPDKIKTAQPHLTMIPHKVDLDLGILEFEQYIIFLITPPNSGIGIVHTDKSRFHCINVPIKIDLEKGPYIAIKEEYLHSIPPGKSFVINNKTGYTWDYNEDQFERVQITDPIFCNTGIPHSWDNSSDDYRVLGSIYFKEPDVETASLMVDPWV